jgi:hypothetical protein
MLTAFLDENVEFLLVGGYAVIAHGHVRTTGDIDLWINPSFDNAKRVWRALLKFRAPLSKIVETDFADPNIFYFIGIPPFRIDILGSVEGLEFSKAWAQRIQVPFDGLAVPTLSKDDLIANKLAVGRPKDLQDVRSIQGPKKKKAVRTKKAARPRPKSAKKRKNR